MAQPAIILAGAAGDLGTQIAKALIARGAAVRALVRNNVSAEDYNRLSALGLAVTPAMRRCRFGCRCLRRCCVRCFSAQWVARGQHRAAKRADSTLQAKGKHIS